MAARRLRIDVRPRAEADIDAALDHYLLEGGLDVAERFGGALGEALDRLARNPGIGSPRYADAAAILGLRAWSLRWWPYLVFYVHGADAIDVVRVLHGARDIPVTLAEPDAPEN